MIVCRKATQQEIGLLAEYQATERQLFTSKKLDATKALKVGEYPQDKKLDQNRVAALMKTINTIYNLEETITKT